MKPESLKGYLMSSHADQTVRTYLYYINTFLLHRPNAKTLLYADIISYINEIKAKTRQHLTLPIRLAAIKRYYDYLLETGQRKDHPCRNIRTKRKKHNVQLQDLFTAQELEALLNRENRYSLLELRNKVILSLLIYQAFACAELVKLDTGNVDLDEGTIYIKGSKRNEARTLELRPKQIILIQRYVETSRKKLLKCETDRLLITHRGVPDTEEGINRMIRPLKGLYLDRNLNATTIRQSVISNMLNQQKLPLEYVQLFAGHKWPSATEKYRSMDISEKRALINKFHPLE